MVICTETDCTKRAMYGTELKKPVKCHIHKLDTMRDCVRNRRKCLDDKCNNFSPTFNLPHEKLGIYCFTHKKNDMIDVSTIRCLEKNCNSISPSYNYPNKKGGRYCSIHKKDTMINVTHKKCAFDGCNLISPNFNIPGSKIGIFCSIHKTDLMIDVHHPKCVYEMCTNSALYNYKNNKKGLYCKIHKLNEMINILAKYCVNDCGIMLYFNSKYKGYCARCFASTFPNEPMTRNIKTKERDVVEFIVKHYQNLEWIFDKRIKEGTSLRRPDAFLDLNDYVIIIEIDENQHAYYDCSCSNKRLLQLSIDVTHKPMVIIRFNPDSYYDSQNKKISSCWSINKETGLLTINDANKWNERLTCLKSHIDYWLVNKTDKLIEPIELFYDQNIL